MSRGAGRTTGQRVSHTVANAQTGSMGWAESEAGKRSERAGLGRLATDGVARDLRSPARHFAPQIAQMGHLLQGRLCSNSPPSQS
jgi:hypothetical protein